MTHPTFRVIPDEAHVVVGDRPVEAREFHLAHPRGAAAILCDTGGLDGVAVEAVNRLAEHGYETVAIELPATADDTAAATTVDALVSHLGRRGWLRAQIGLIGFGAGGRAVVSAATGDPLGVAVAIHPTGVPAASATTPAARTALLVVVAGGDPGCDAASVDRFRVALDLASPASTEVIRYPAVRSGFLTDALDGPALAAAFEAWERAVETFNGHVAPRPTMLALAWVAQHPHPDSEITALTVPFDADLGDRAGR